MHSLLKKLSFILLASIILKSPVLGGQEIGSTENSVKSTLGNQERVTIIDFEFKRDMRSLLSLYKRNFDFLQAFPSGYIREPVDYYKSFCDFIESCRLMIPHAKDAIPGSLTIKVLKDATAEGLIGYISYYVDTIGQGEIKCLAVDEAYRGKEYGRSLLHNAINYMQAKGANTIRISVMVTNHIALNLYKKIGLLEQDLVWGYDVIRSAYQKLSENVPATLSV